MLRATDKLALFDCSIIPLKRREDSQESYTEQIENTQRVNTTSNITQCSCYIHRSICTYNMLDYWLDEIQRLNLLIQCPFHHFILSPYWNVCVVPYLPIIVMVMRLDVFLNQVGLHWNEKVTCRTVGSLHFSHEVLHTKIYTREKKSAMRSLPLHLTHTVRQSETDKLLTPGEILLFVHLADGSTVIFQLINPLLCLLKLVLQILLQNQTKLISVSSNANKAKKVSMEICYSFIHPITVQNSILLYVWVGSSPPKPVYYVIL